MINALTNTSNVQVSLYKEKLKERESQLQRKEITINEMNDKMMKELEKSNMHQVDLMASNEIIKVVK